VAVAPPCGGTILKLAKHHKEKQKKNEHLVRSTPGQPYGNTEHATTLGSVVAILF
jgi:hypothetical protein